MKAKIGIVICGMENNRQFVTNSYIRAVHKAGGLPILLPMVRSDTVISDYTTLCDGFLFCGGNDVTPLLFGEEPRKGIGETDITLDIFQIRLMKAVLKSKKPLLAICRGMQVLNIACGGSIYHDLSEVPDAINHMQTSTTRKDVSHRVAFEPGSRLHRLFGDFAYTNSFHHQAINIPGEDIVVTGKTGDDIIEAIEIPTLSFAVGVQWHPESMLQKNGKMWQLFHAFLLAVRAY